jgi:hypothetical protein
VLSVAQSADVALQSGLVRSNDVIQFSIQPCLTRNAAGHVGADTC